MRILQLRFSNINSLAGTWDIDFTADEFRRSALFCISGPTGSGKSTILDAISLALWGDTPRTAASTASLDAEDVCPVLTKGERTAEAAVRFEADGREYLSRWRRRIKRTGTVSAPEVELIAFTSSADTQGTVIAEKINEWRAGVCRVTNMTFEIFTRSVLLAQGAFANFLRARDDDRANLLEKITGTDIYSTISTAIYRRSQAEKAALETMLARLEGMSVLPEEERKALETALQKLSAALPQAKSARNEAQKLLDWRRQLETLEAAAQKAAAALTAAREAEAAHAPEAERAVRARRAALPALRLAAAAERETALTAAQNDRTRADTDHRQALDCLPALETALKRAAEKAAAAKDEAAAFEPLYIDMTARDQRIAEMRRTGAEESRRAETAAAGLTAAGAALTQARSDLATGRTAHEALLAQKTATAADDNLREPIAQIEMRLPAYKKASLELTEAKKKFEAARAAHSPLKTSAAAAQERAAQTGAALARADQIFKAAQDTKQNLLQGQTLPDLLARMQTLTGRLENAARLTDLDRLNTAPDLGNTARAVSAEIRAEILLRFPELVGCTPAVTAAFEAEREALLTQSRSVTEADNALREAQETLRSARAAAETANREAQQLSEKLQAAGLTLAHAETEVTRVTQECETQRNAIRSAVMAIPGVSADEDPNTVFKTLRLRVHTREQLLADESKAAAAVSTAQAAAARAEAVFEAARQKEAEAAAARKTALERLENERRERTEKYGTTDPTARRQTLTDAAKTAEDTRAAADTALRNAQTAAKNAEGKLQVCTAAVTRLSAEAAAAAAAAAEALAQSGFATPEEVRAAALPEQTADAIEARGKALAEERAAAEGAAKAAGASLAAHRALALTEKPLETLAQACAAAEAETDRLTTELSRTKTSLADDDSRRQKADEAAKAADLQRQKADEWSALSGLIGSADGKKFRTAAQKITFRILLKYANEAMRTMTDRYILISSGTSGMGIDVLDNDMGARTRTSQNLSGGETFMASLALALGLSRMGGSNLRVDTLFLDEGFGTLDEAALNKALYALEKLQQQSGKLIGVISHVASIRERIEARIELTPKPGSGRSTLRGPGVRCLAAPGNPA